MQNVFDRFASPSSSTSSSFFCFFRVVMRRFSVLFHSTLNCSKSILIEMRLQNRLHVCHRFDQFRTKEFISTQSLIRIYFVVRAFIENHSNTKIVIVIIFTSLELIAPLMGWFCGWKWDSLLWFQRVLLRSIHIITNSNIDSISHSAARSFYHPSQMNKWKQFDKFLQLFLCWLAIFDEVSVPL